MTTFRSWWTKNDNKCRPNLNIRQQQGLLEIIRSGKNFTSENLSFEAKITNCLQKLYNSKIYCTIFAASFPPIFFSSSFQEGRIRRGFLCCGCVNYAVECKKLSVWSRISDVCPNMAYFTASFIEFYRINHYIAHLPYTFFYQIFWPSFNQVLEPGEGASAVSGYSCFLRVAPPCPSHAS